MTKQRIALIVVLALFLIATGEVIYEHGYIGFYRLALANSATQLMGFDLVISLGLICAWMGIDAERRGRSPWAYVLLTLLFGAAGPLAYLIARGSGEAAEVATERS